VFIFSTSPLNWPFQYQTFPREEKPFGFFTPAADQLQHLVTPTPENHPRPQQPFGKPNQTPVLRLRQPPQGMDNSFR
jgi:hypothetical protein